MSYKSNICIIGLATEFTKSLAEMLSKRLDMFYADVDALIEFDLINVNEAELICGKDFLLQIEKKKIKEVCYYENTVIAVDYSLLNNESCKESIRSKCLVIYIKLKKEDFIRLIENDNTINFYSEFMFEDRNKLCEELCDINFDCNFENDDVIIEKIIRDIKIYYNKKEDTDD